MSKGISVELRGNDVKCPSCNTQLGITVNVYGGRPTIEKIEGNVLTISKEATYCDMCKRETFSMDKDGYLVCEECEFLK
jgi:hypothetical protein